MIRDEKKSAVIAERKAASPSGLPIEAVVTANDLPERDAERDLGYPGQFPFTRGVYPTMYRGRLWTTRQYAASAAPSNRTNATVTCSRKA
jgi:methylmalonyl-CoA mutase N-terminal domain/subunit